MEFFGIGAWELMVIGLIALIVLGPKQMIVLARKAGELLRQFQAMWQEASRTIHQEIQSIEADGSDLTGLGGELQQIGREVQEGIKITLPANGGAPRQTIQPPASPPPPIPASAWASSPAPPPGPAASTGAPAENTSPVPEPQPADTPAPEANKYSAWTNKPPTR